MSFAVCCAALVFGIAFGRFFDADWYDVLLALSLGLAVCAYVMKHPMVRLVLFGASLFVFGVFRYTQAILPPIPSVGDPPASAIRVRGTIAREVEKRFNRTRVIIDDVTFADHPREGKLLVWLSPETQVHYGNILSFSCTVESPEPIEGFRYDHFLRAQGIYAICPRPNALFIDPPAHRTPIGLILAMKERFVLGLTHIVPEPHAGFLSGLIFGGSSSLSKDLQDDFSKTGTSHILAASGFNISLFTFVFLGWIIQTPLGRRRGIIFTFFLIGGYVVMAGLTAAVVRAAVMASMLLLAQLVRRQPNMRNIILASLALLLLSNPLLLYDDVGFQLSFVATVAVMTLPKRWESAFAFLPDRFGIREALVGSLSAIVLTFPIITWHFGVFSVVSPVVNLLILPLIPFTMAFGLIALGVSFLSVPIATLFAVPAWLLSYLILQIIRVYASVSFAQLPLAASHAIALASTALLTLYLLWLYKPHVWTAAVRAASAKAPSAPS